MKSKEEIKLMGESYATTHEDVSDRLGKYLVSACFQDGYTQRQEEMTDKKFTEEDMRQAMIIALVSNSVNGSKDIDDYIKSLNKQD